TIGTINGKTKADLRRMVFDVAINDFQRKIVSAGPSDDIGAMFEVIAKELDSMVEVFRQIEWRNIFFSFPNSSTLSDREKLKFLIAYLSQPNYVHSLIVTKVLNEMLALFKTLGVEYTE